jgi:hypothetical protein
MQTGPSAPASRAAPGDGVTLRARDRFEDTMRDIPLQRPAEPAAELVRFAQEVSGRG